MQYTLSVLAYHDPTVFSTSGMEGCLALPQTRIAWINPKSRTGMSAICLILTPEINLIAPLGEIQIRTLYVLSFPHLEMSFVVVQGDVAG